MAVKHRVCWEAVDRDGGGFAHGFTLKETKACVDCELDSDNKNATL